MSDFVLAATAWKSNAELIADVARLGYIKKSDLALDMTYGKGVWWRAWRPDELVENDRYVEDIEFNFDYRGGFPDLWCEEFDLVAFDPPYIAMGGRKSSTEPDFTGRYGLLDAAKNPADMQCDFNAGICEAYRLLKPGGILVMKNKDYINSGQLWMATHHTLTHALAAGFKVVDRLEHLGRTGPQSQTTQVHARRNFSTLFIFKKV